MARHTRSRCPSSALARESTKKKSRLPCSRERNARASATESGVLDRSASPSRWRTPYNPDKNYWWETLPPGGGSTMKTRDAESVLVTGASGFIGQHLVRRLIERGERAACL